MHPIEAYDSNDEVPNAPIQVGSPQPYLFYHVRYGIWMWARVVGVKGIHYESQHYYGYDSSQRIRRAPFSVYTKDLGNFYTGAVAMCDCGSYVPAYGNYLKSHKDPAVHLGCAITRTLLSFEANYPGLEVMVEDDDVELKPAILQGLSEIDDHIAPLFKVELPDGCIETEAKNIYLNGLRVLLAMEHKLERFYGLFKRDLKGKPAIFYRDGAWAPGTIISLDVKSGQVIYNIEEKFTMRTVPIKASDVRRYFIEDEVDQQVPVYMINRHVCDIQYDGTFPGPTML